MSIRLKNSGQLIVPFNSFKKINNHCNHVYYLKGIMRNYIYINLIIIFSKHYLILKMFAYLVKIEEYS